MRMNPAMLQAHMQRMEQHMANIETLLRQLSSAAVNNNFASTNLYRPARLSRWF